MADFVKLDGYNVKDALAGKSLSISGDQLSLLKADGTAASTVTIPKGMKVYHVGLQYKDTVTDQTQYASILDAVALGQGSWSVYSITEVLTGASVATTTKIEDLMEEGLVYVTASILFTAQGTNIWYSLDTHILDSRVSFTISNGVQNYVQGWLSVAINTTTNVITTSSITKVSGGGSSTLAGLSDVDVTGVTNGQVLTYDSNSSEWVPTTPSSGGSGAPDGIIGTIEVDMTGQNITTSSFVATIGIPVAVDTMTKLRLSVKCPQGWPTDVGSLAPIACTVKAGYSAVYDTIQAAVDAGDGSNISAISLFYEWKPGSWIKVTLNATYNNGSIAISSGSAASAASLLQ